MSNILYYPYINLPKTDWTLRTLLYYENIGAIVPQEYFEKPQKHYDDFMLELVDKSLVEPINPIHLFDNPWEVTKPFIEHIGKNKSRIEKAQVRFSKEEHWMIHKDKFKTAKIHADKFDGEVFYSLEQIGLAKRDEGNFYLVESKTADQLMKFLATIVGMKTQRIPTTDQLRPRIYSSKNLPQKRKRDTILKELIPFPEQIDLKKLLNFKEKHNDLLKVFQNRVETIVLDPTIIEDSPLFNEKIRELVIRKGELTAKMNESQFGKIIFGTVCGIIGVAEGVVHSSNLNSVLWGLPGFANAVHSALKIERAENLFDQSGLKYLALVDKRLR